MNRTRRKTAEHGGVRVLCGWETRTPSSASTAAWRAGVCARVRPSAPLSCQCVLCERLVVSTAAHLQRNLFDIVGAGEGLKRGEHLRGLGLGD